MILAAGRGERMRPLTDHTPKALLRVGGKALVVWIIEALARAGFTELVINVSHFADRIEGELEDGRRWGLAIRYSREAEALETAGGIRAAMRLLGSAPFLVVNGDIHTDYDFSRLAQPLRRETFAHLVLVENPPHHPQGDFSLADGCASTAGPKRYTFSGIGVYQPALFAPVPEGEKYQLAALLRPQMEIGRVSAELYSGHWTDVGTPERLEQLEHSLEA